MSALVSKNLRHLKNRLGIRANLIQLLRSHSTKSILYKITPLNTHDDPTHEEPQSNHDEPPHEKPYSKPPHKIDLSPKNTNISHRHVESVQYYEDPNGKTNWPATFFVFDLETTGLSRENDRIVELAFRHISSGKNNTIQSLVNPGRKITDRISKIHGITTSMVSQPGIPTLKELTPFLVEFLETRKIEGKPLVLIAHNGKSFDFPFLENEFCRCGFEFPEDWLFLDTRTLANLCIKGPKGLEDLKEYYKISSQGHAHRAMADVDALCLVFKQLTFDLKLTPDDLMKYCITASQINLSKKKQMLRGFF